LHSVPAAHPLPDVPDVAALHVPTDPVTVHDWHSPPHAALQQTPPLHPPAVRHSRQSAVMQSAPADVSQAAPCAFRATQVPEAAQ
jgi:hypothetical protein